MSKDLYRRCSSNGVESIKIINEGIDFVVGEKKKKKKKKTN